MCLVSDISTDDTGKRSADSVSLAVTNPYPITAFAKAPFGTGLFQISGALNIPRNQKGLFVGPWNNGPAGLWWIYIYIYIHTVQLYIYMHVWQRVIYVYLSQRYMFTSEQVARDEWHENAGENPGQTDPEWHIPVEFLEILDIFGFYQYYPVRAVNPWHMLIETIICS